MSNRTAKKECEYLTKLIIEKKASEIKDVTLCEESKLEELESKVDSLCKQYNVDFRKTEILFIEKVEQEISQIFENKETARKQKVKYYDKLSGFCSRRKQNLMWNESKIDEFFASLMK